MDEDGIYPGPDLTFERVLDAEDVAQVAAELDSAWHRILMGGGEPDRHHPMRVMVNGFGMMVTDKGEISLIRNAMMAAICGGPSDIEFEITG